MSSSGDEAAKKPLVSVIMPVHNCEKYLDEAVSSILDQTFEDFELILINDGSTDRSDEIVRKYLKDGRLVYEVNATKRGIVYSLNRALELSRADIVARMDGDDVSMPSRLETQYRFLQEHHDIALVGSCVEFIDESGCSRGVREVVTGPENIRRVFFFYGPHRHPTIMFRKEAVDGIGRYRDYDLCQDIDLYFRLILSGYRTDNIPVPLLKYRVHPENSDKRFKEKGVSSFKMKKDVIREFGVKLSAVNRTSMYVHYALDRCLSAERKHQVETVIKELVDRVQRCRSSALARSVPRLRDLKATMSIGDRAGRLRVNKVPGPIKALIGRLGSAFYRTLLAGRRFSFMGADYRYLNRSYKLTWLTERGVEIPIVLGFVEAYRGREILEVGHVLKHYFRLDHEVLDKYEKAPGVMNEDLVKFSPDSRYDLIVSVSTVEHIGFDEDEKEPGKAGRAMERLVQLLAPGGKAVITVPLGYNPEIDSLLADSWPPIADIHYLRKISNWNTWEETDPQSAFLAADRGTYFWLNAVAVVIIDEGGKADNRQAS